MRSYHSFTRFIFLLLLLAGHVTAADWIADLGEFTDPSSWAGGLPNAGEDIFVNNGGLATLSSGTFQAGGAFIGSTQDGFAEIAGGEFAIGGNSIHVGWRPTGVGELTINGLDAVVTSGDDFQLGREGVGTLNFSAGQLRAGYAVVGKFGTGVWNQSGGLFDQDFGDFEIGDGGGDGDAGVQGPRTGIVNITGGYVQTADSLAIGNRRGTGTVSISGGVIAATGSSDSNIIIGKGANSSPGTGGDTELRVIGGESFIFANGDFSMNTSNVSQSSTLVAEITGPTHTAIRVGGNADIGNGDLRIELNGYTPSVQDIYILVEAGADLTSDVAIINALVDVDGYRDLEHADQTVGGRIMGEFASVDTSLAPLPNGLRWELGYAQEQVFLGIVGGEVPSGDFDENGRLEVIDIDLLMNEVAAGTNDVRFDLSGDGLVTDADRDQWLAEAGPANGLAGPYLLGDANLDASVNAGDLNVLGVSWLSENNNWSQGNFTGAGANVADLNALALNWQDTVPAAAAAVPEPSGIFIALLLTFGLLARFQHRRTTRRPCTIRRT